MAQRTTQSFATARNSLTDGQWQRLLVNVGLGVFLAIVFGTLLVNRLADISLSQTIATLSGVTPAQWAAATVATTASFWAIGHYDNVIHRYLATGIPRASAHRAGVTAIAVSQTLGLGVITGAILRWRMLPGISLWQATKLTTMVAVFFLFGWAFVTAIVLTFAAQAPLRQVAVCFVAAAPLAIVAGTLFPRLFRGHLPNLFIIVRLVALAALDLGTAALALWVLCPPDLALPFATLLPAFLIAFGAGLISGTPAGVGAFEITFLALLPHLPETPLLGAVLAWRTIYFVLPAITGAIIALRGPVTHPGFLVHVPQLTPLEIARRAETALVRQGQLVLEGSHHGHAWATGRTPHCMIGMLDPLLGPTSVCIEPLRRKQAVADLIEKSKSENRLPVLYKCSARTAIAARQSGLSLHPVAREAWLDPRNFTLETPSRAGLRRKLRHAAKSGVSVRSGPHDRSDLFRIAKEWAANHGGERGFSLGRFDPAYLAQQGVYVAHSNGKAVAFASFHTGETEWTLDLLRHTSEAPDGTMHALIAGAIADATACNLPRLSLSAVPIAALSAAPKGHFARLVHWALGGNLKGLAQFKSAFVPQWQTLYLAAPHKPGLILAAAEIAREVHFPPPLPLSAHYHHEQYEIASGGQSWHRVHTTL